jgi:hypothetical protein
MFFIQVFIDKATNKVDKNFNESLGFFLAGSESNLYF